MIDRIFEVRLAIKIGRTASIGGRKLVDLIFNGRQVMGYLSKTECFPINLESIKLS